VICSRKPSCLANWKMHLTVDEGISWFERVVAQAGSILDRADVLVLVPYTALWPLSRTVYHPSIAIGAQNSADTNDPPHTGQVSPRLLREAGAQWVGLNHWEVRRHLLDTDQVVNHKVRLALETGLKTLVFIGEEQDDSAGLEGLSGRLGRVFEGVPCSHASDIVLVYEPEAAIGQVEPLPASHVQAGCRLLRAWAVQAWGQRAGHELRVLYGGSVTPGGAGALMHSAELDGLGATRRALDPQSFVEVIRQVVAARAPLARDGP